jgi:hypothetical protein
MYCILLDCFSFAIAKCTVSQNKSFPLRLLFGRRGRGSGGHDGSWKGQVVPAARVAGAAQLRATATFSCVDIWHLYSTIRITQAGILVYGVYLPLASLLLNLFSLAFNLSRKDTLWDSARKLLTIYTHIQYTYSTIYVFSAFLVLIHRCTLSYKYKRGFCFIFLFFVRTLFNTASSAAP